MKLNKILTLSASLLLLVGCGGQTSSSSSSSEENSFCSTLNVTKQIQDVLGGRPCPSKGKVKALIVPINFSDVSTKINTNLIKSSFGVEGGTLTPEWVNVKDFYSTSSYGNFEWDFVFEDEFVPNKPSTYYEDKATFQTNDTYNVPASRTLYKEVMSALDTKYDFNEFDSNNDQIVDAMFMVYNHSVDYTYSNMFYWAYNATCIGEETFDGCKLGHYVWCGQDFFTKDNKVCNTETIIHEASHSFGIDDYYDYDSTTGTNKGGLHGADLMDNDNGSPSGDHNSYSKSILGWTKPKLVSLPNKEDEYIVQLKPFEENGDCLILSNEFDKDKEMFQEYFLLEYYTPTSLNELEKPFSIPGVRMLHISSQLTSSGKIKYDNSRTTYKLISQITNSNGGTYINETTPRDDSTLFVQGDKLLSAQYNNGDELKYQFEVVSLNESEVSIKITRKY